MPSPAPGVLQKSATTGGGADLAPEDRTASDRGVLATDDRRAAYTLTRTPPGPAVAGRVERHWTTAWDLEGREDHESRVLPHPCVNLVAYDGIVRVHGVPTGRFVRRLTGRGRAIGTKFRPGAFAALTAIPMVALRDEAATCAEAFGPAGEALEHDLLAAAAADDVDGARGAVEAFLAPRLPDRDPTYDLVVGVARDLLRRSPEARIPEVARDHGVSDRTLQRAFRAAIGVSPKWVLARYRLHEATERLAGEPGQDLGRLALDLGYADQAHFSGDFRATVGVPPSAYAAACRALATA